MPIVFSNLIDYRNFFWDGHSEREVIDAAGKGQSLPVGQYGFALQQSDRVFLARDPLGCNKLFFGATRNGVVVAANRVVKVWRSGVALERIFSCPPGRVLVIGEGRIRQIGGVDPWSQKSATEFDLAEFKAAVNASLDRTFQHIAKAAAGHRVVVCLSGGLDSSVIASWAVRYFDEVVAASFTYLDGDDLQRFSRGEGPEQWLTASEDFRNAKAVAESLGMQLLPVVRPKEAVAGAVLQAVRLGQDWRDFNVHCATVNLFLAQDIRAAFPGEDVLVLTGDLMNEFVCDYREEMVGGTAYYKIPNVDLASRRKYFVRGLDAGDREIGVMSAFGLAVCQPFAALVDHYFRVPAELLQDSEVKWQLNGHLLADAAAVCVGRKKTRAQVGGDDLGTLGIYHQLGVDNLALQKLWRGVFPGETSAACDGLIHLGRYRPPSVRE